MFDSIVVNAKIYSMEKEGEFFTAMGITSGKISQLYSKGPENPESLATIVIDAQGLSIFPGFTDSHMHFMLTSLVNEVGIPISEVMDGKIHPTSFQDLKHKVQSFASKKYFKHPLLFSNFVVPSFSEGHLPYRDQIDAWLPGRIVIFLSIDGHACSLSSEALLSIGIDPTDHNGLLTEDMPEFDIEKLYQLVSDRIGFKSILNGMKTTLNEAIKYGIVDLHSMEGINNDIADDVGLKFMFKFSGKFPVHIHLYPQIRNVVAITPYLKFMASPRVGGCMNWEIDGSVGARTAAFYDPYLSEPENRGSILFPQEQLLQDVSAAYAKKFQITAHAIGTRAIDELLQVYEEVLKRNSDMKNRYRFRIDHFEFPSKKAIERAIQDLNLIIVPQPGFNWINAHFPSMHLYEKYLKPDIVALQNPLQSITTLGGIICGSSDSPVQPLNPFLQIHGMVNFPIETERLSVYEAFRTYTYNGAYASHSELTRGTLSVGKQADFIVLTENPFEIESHRLLNLKVHSTYIAGKKITAFKGGPLKFFFQLLFSKRKLI